MPDEKKAAAVSADGRGVETDPSSTTAESPATTRLRLDYVLAEPLPNPGPDDWDDEEDIEPPTPTPVEVQLEDALGPAGPKETVMPSPVQKDAGSKRASRAIAWVVGGLVVPAVVVLGIGEWKGRPAVPEPTGTVIMIERPAEPLPPADAVTATEAVSDHVPPLPVPKPAATKPTAPPEPTNPVVAAVPESPPAPPPTETKSIPTTLVITALGGKPKCTSECVWADITDEGLPRIVDGKQKVVCGEDAWMIAEQTWIDSGPQKYCFTATGISVPDEDPIGP